MRRDSRNGRTGRHRRTRSYTKLALIGAETVMTPLAAVAVSPNPLLTGVAIGALTVLACVTAVARWNSSAPAEPRHARLPRRARAGRHSRPTGR